MELQLEAETAPKPVEETLAERRARRQAIRAKYMGIASASLSINTASPSPGPSSAVLQPPPPSSEADLSSKNYSADGTFGATKKPDGSADASTWGLFVLWKQPCLLVTQISLSFRWKGIASGNFY